MFYLSMRIIHVIILEDTSNTVSSINKYIAYAYICIYLHIIFEYMILGSEC